VPVSDDGTANDITVTKSGFVTSTSGDTSNRTANTDAQSTQTLSNTEYVLKVVVNDSNGTAVTGATVTHGGSSAATSVSNAYYFTTSGAWAIGVSKSGFDSLSTNVDTGLLNVGVTSSAQTVVTLTGSIPFTGDLSSGGSSVTGRGLIAIVVSSGGGSSSSSSGGRSGGSSSQRIITRVVPTIPILTTPALCAFGKNLSMGDTGVEVSALQTHLESQGLLVMPVGASKGFFGQITKTAVIAHQSNVNVPTTGYFGPMTRAVTCKTTLSSPVPTVTVSTSSYPRDLSFGFSGDDVASLQTFLESKSYLVLPTGTAKGFFGGYTRDALTKYQASMNISPTGTFGPLTRAAIQRQ
jgi:peptidoglycan hydrolase-like protein with peptidoglycan-binding domain